MVIIMTVFSKAQSNVSKLQLGPATTTKKSIFMNSFSQWASH